MSGRLGTGDAAHQLGLCLGARHGRAWGKQSHHAISAIVSPQWLLANAVRQALYYHLTSGVQPRAAAALELLAAAAGRGATASRVIVETFDWSLSSLPKLSRPPQCAHPHAVDLILSVLEERLFAPRTAPCG